MIRYEINFEVHPTKADLEILHNGLNEHIESLFGNSENTPLTFFLRNEDDIVVGGVHGNYGEFGWLYISTLWVSEKIRGHSFGAQLMEHIEAEAAKAGCSNAYLDTFSFQAPGFYERLGYKRFGELEDFPAGHSRIFLRKRLVPREPNGAAK